MYRLIITAILILGVLSCEKQDDAYLFTLNNLSGDSGLSYNESFKIWKELKEQNGDSYIYQTEIESWTGYSAITTVTVANNKVTKRSFQASMQTSPSGATKLMEEYIEIGSEVGTHTSGTAPVTIDELYETCAANYLSVDKENNTLYFNTAGTGLMTLCGFVPDECMDDCFRGVRISGFQWFTGSEVIVSDEFYKNAPQDPFRFKKVEMKGDSLIVTVEYGGGCGDASFTLVASEAISKSNPPQRNVRLSFKDDDDCEALIKETLIFDLNPLKLEGGSSMIINLMDWDKPLVYIYN